MIALPEDFVRRGLPEGLAAALDGESPTSVRFNPYKVASKPEDLRQVPWCKYGYYLDRRPQFALDPQWHGGAYYVQEASSMFVGQLVDDWEGLRVLDLCAAPGGKTTLLSTLVGLDGLVVANETVRTRAHTLTDNVARWGLGNVVVTNNDPSHFEALSGFFDVILVDAPCSGEGMFRRNRSVREEWSEAAVELCARRQRRILSNIWSTLRPGGYLIYSTCTFNRAENEDNIEWLAEKYGASIVEVPAPEGVEFSGAGYLFWPHLIEGEGFFAAAVRRPDDKVRSQRPKPRHKPLVDVPRGAAAELRRWVAQPEYMNFAQAGDSFYGFYDRRFGDVHTLAGALSVVYSGVQMGQIFKGTLRPDHSLALFHGLSATPVDLPLDEALNYLRKSDVDPSLLAEGMNAVAFEGLPIGWAKRIGERVNNLYPKELRILNL